MNIQIPRGTYDLFGDDMRLHLAVKEDVLSIFNNYGYSQIKTPIFEHTNLFVRSVGESSDIVSKEMYTFADKSDRSLTLRPELTAPVVRSFLENKMYGEPVPFHKLCYYGETFRYERSQAGRYRQFHQMGVECFGISAVGIESETIAMGVSLVKKLGIKNAILKINTIGSSQARGEYRTALQSYFAPVIDDFCSDCQARISKNPLRILDCKVDHQNQYIINAPKLWDYIDDTSKQRFLELQSQLDDLGIEYQIDETLVRGLDYYNDTVFEIEYNDGQQSFALVGGGRYDNLVSQFNERQQIPAFGFGFGLERLIIAIKQANPEILEQVSEQCEIYYMPRSEKALEVCVKSANKLRDAGLKCEIDYTISSFKSAFRRGEKLGCVYAVIIGENELEGDYATIKHLVSFESAEVKLVDFEEDLINEGEEHEHK